MDPRQPQPDGMSGLDAAFARVIGASWRAELVASFALRPVVLVAGDQLTGKSVAAAALAERLGGVAASSGSVVRQMAVERGLSVEEMSRGLAREPDIDVRIDYRAAGLIAAGGAAVFESRLAGHLGQRLRTLGRQRLATVYLSCAPRERALRYLYRELRPEVRARLEPVFIVDEQADFATCLSSLEGLGDRDVAEALPRLRQAARRDDEDRARLLALYGVDYCDRTVFDLVVDTTRRRPEQTVERVLEALPALG